VLIHGLRTGRNHYAATATGRAWKSEWLLPIPGAFSFAEAWQSARRATAAMACRFCTEDTGVKPESGPVVVTGRGRWCRFGCGRAAVEVGWRLIASTGRVGEAAYLKNLGVAEIIRAANHGGERACLAKERWAGRHRQCGFEDHWPTSSPPRVMASCSCVRSCGGMDFAPPAWRLSFYGAVSLLRYRIC